MNNPQNNLIFALDIGTRSVIGIVGERREDMFHVLYMAKEEHSRRAMVDGQIEDIEQVARVVKAVKDNLEEQVGHPLSRVCVAAAGRSLRMERARALVELPEIHTITDDLISQLEAVAIADAEEKLSEHNKDQRFYLVGYTVAQYMLDHYPMTTIKGHNGQIMEADVVATFLPSQVVEGLYSVVNIAGLEVASLTLEPIAALNATIPPDLRLLNLVLVDIGAGTSDIAVCRDGSVVGYTMATTAGDEITEMLMKHYLVDFQTAETMKTNLNASELKYTDVLGLEQNTSGKQIAEAIEGGAKNLVKEIAKQIFAINGCAPSAVFMAGGGSKLDGITTQLSSMLEIPSHRIAVAGTNYSRSIVAENFKIEDPEFATPLGIAVSAALGLINDSYHITLNGKGAKLFRSGSLTLLDILMMNGYTAAALIGRTGKNLAIMINGNKKIIRGKPSVPGVLKLNGDSAVAGAMVSAGDVIEFIPAIDGLSASCTLHDLLGDYAGKVLLNGMEAPWDTPLRNGDSITTFSGDVQFTPTHLRKGPRALSAHELNPVDAFGNPIGTATPAEPVSDYADVSVNPDSVELPSLSKGDEDVKIYGADNITPIPLDMELELEDGDEALDHSPAPVVEDTPSLQGYQPDVLEDAMHQQEQAHESVVDFPETEEHVPQYAPEAVEQESPESYDYEPETVDVPEAQPAYVPEIPQVPVAEEAYDSVSELTPETAFASEETVFEPAPLEEHTAQIPKIPEIPEIPEYDPSPIVLPPVGDDGKVLLRQGNVTLNGNSLYLPQKSDNSPYYLMDLLDKTNIDFRHVTKPILMMVNGEEGYFVKKLYEGDDVIISEQ